MAVHLDRFSTSGVQTRKMGVVIHDSESPDGSYASLARFVTLPGDRLIAGSNPPRKYGACYHALTRNDAAATYDQILPATAGPYAAPPLNKNWWHICIPGYARQNRQEWMDAASLSGIKAVALFIVDKAKVDGFPLARVRTAGLLAGDGGYTSHADVSNAWHQTDHSDPGGQFPWDLLAQYILDLVLPTMPPAPPRPTVHPAAAAAQETIMRFVGSLDHPGSTRWVLSGSVRILPTFESANYLIRTGQVTNSLETADLLTDAELAGLPVVG